MPRKRIKPIISPVTQPKAEEIKIPQPGNSFPEPRRASPPETPPKPVWVEAERVVREVGTDRIYYAEFKGKWIEVMSSAEESHRPLKRGKLTLIEVMVDMNKPVADPVINKAVKYPRPDEPQLEIVNIKP